MPKIEILIFIPHILRAKDMPDNSLIRLFIYIATLLKINQAYIWGNYPAMWKSFPK